MVIPKYPFEPDSATGNPQFRININDSIVNYKKSDFLVPHRKDYYFFAFVTKGNSRHWIDMTPYTLKPNTLYFTVPHQVHLKEEAHELSGISWSFTDAFLAADETGFLRNLPIIQNPHNGHELTLEGEELAFTKDMLSKIITEYQTPNDWQQQMLLGYMKTLLIFMSRIYLAQTTEAMQSESKALLKSYLDHIEKSYTSLHDVAAYATLMNISAGHLGDRIKEQSGKPAITHIHERIMLEARRLLFHTDLAVKEIAFQLGFEDASYFNRFFKRCCDQTPVEFRTLNREMYH